jgi:hypothetical protein
MGGRSLNGVEISFVLLESGGALIREGFHGTKAFVPVSKDNTTSVLQAKRVIMALLSLGGYV